jgi:argininosuccinate lyase
LTRTGEMLTMTALAIPALEVDARRGAAALEGGAVATDEVMRRVETGMPFREAYREVARALKAGQTFDAPPTARLLERLRSTGGLGRLGLQTVWRRWNAARRWSAGERRRFHGALDRLRGKRKGRTR